MQEEKPATKKQNQTHFTCGYSDLWFKYCMRQEKDSSLLLGELESNNIALWIAAKDIYIWI